MALRHRPYDIPDRYRQVDIDPEATIEAGRNILGHTWDYWNEQGDFARPVKWQKTEGAQKMEADSTNQIEAPGTSEARSGGTATGVGFRGKLAGKTQTDIGYEKHYHERMEAHSLKLRTFFYTWGLSPWGPTGSPTGESLKFLLPWSNYPGLVCIYNTDQSTSPDAVNAFMPLEQQRNSIQEHIYGNAINFYIGDFFDHKTLNDPVATNTKKGVLNNYRKIRLKSFTVTITPKSYKQTTFEANPYLFDKAEHAMVPFKDNQSFSKVKHITDIAYDLLPQDYWVYRDIYGYYNNSTTGLIPAIPPDSKSTATAPDAIERTVYQIKAFDNQVQIMNDQKPFSFTRTINPQGSYYLTPNNLWDNRNKPIANLVNELEGQTGAATNSMINKFPEYFNFVFAPINPPIKLSHRLVISCNSTGGNVKDGTIPMVQCSTSLHVKFQATWEAFDFDHKTIPINFAREALYDPLFRATNDYEHSLMDTQNNIRAGI